MKKYSGTLDLWFETGTEGLVWVLRNAKDDPELLYDRLAIINAGDHLTVRDNSDNILFDGIIKEDHDAGWQPYEGQLGGVRSFFARHWERLPKFVQKLLSAERQALYNFVYKHWGCTPRYTHWLIYPPLNGQPAALGYNIHWTQRGWEPDDWARLFLRDKLLRAVLIKK